MKRPDPRLQRVERLLTEAMRLLTEVKTGIPAPRRRKKTRRRYRLPQILIALREGAPLDARGKDRDPRLPSRTTLAKYRNSNREFDREAGEVLRQRAKNSSQKKGRLLPNPGAVVWASRLPGSGYNWDEIASKIEAGATIGPGSANRQGLPSHTLIMARRKADPVFAARVAAVLHGRFGLGRRAVFDLDSVLELIRRGSVIKSSPPQPGMPRKEFLDRARREDPIFNAAVLAAIAEARRRRTNRNRLAKLPRTAAWDVSQGTIPRSLDPELRGDLVNELCLMICSGEVGVDGDLQRAWRTCRTRINSHRWKEKSLDAPIPGTDGLRAIDLLDDDSPRF